MSTIDNLFDEIVRKKMELSNQHIVNRINRRIFAVDPARRSLKIVVFIMAIIVVSFLTGYVQGRL